MIEETNLTATQPAVNSNEMLDRRDASERGVCFLGYRGVCGNPDCPHTLNETTECERCGSEFVFNITKTV